MRTNCRSLFIFLTFFCSQASVGDPSINELALIVEKVECHEDGMTEVCHLFSASGKEVSSLSCEDKSGDLTSQFVSIDIKVAGYNERPMPHQFASAAECKRAKNRLNNKQHLPLVLLFTKHKHLVSGYQPTGTVRLIDLVD